MTQDPTGYTIRRALADDSGTIARQRAAMFFEMGAVSAAEAEILRTESEPWLARILSNGDYLGWFCEQDGVIVAGAGILIQDIGPRPGCLRLGRGAHVVNACAIARGQAVV